MEHSESQRYFNPFDAENSLGNRRVYMSIYNNYEEYVEFAKYGITFTLTQTVEIRGFPQEVEVIFRTNTACITFNWLR
jgi:hypothetical protein